MLGLTASLLAAGAAAASAPSQERPMLDAFRTVCDKVDDLEGMKTAALADGWEEISDTAEPRLERLIRLGKEASEDHGTSNGFNFRRTMDGRTLMLVASRYEEPSGIWANGCRLYDFDAAAPVPDDVLNAWMGRPPTGTEAAAPALGLKRSWEPGWRDGMTVEIINVSPTSPLKEAFGLSGNALVASALGGF